MPVEEENGAERLVLGGGGEVSFNDQVGDKLIDFGNAHLAGVALVVVQDKLAHPIEVGFLGAARVLFHLQHFAVLVEELFRLGRCLRVHGLDFWRVEFYNSVHKALCVCFCIIPLSGSIKKIASVKQ